MSESFSNRYGTVSDQTINFYRGEGLSMHHVVSAQLALRRHLLGGLFVTVMALVSFFGVGSGGAIFFGFLLLLWAAFLFWGSPQVLITAADGHVHRSNGKPWDRAEASRFVGAVNRELNRSSPSEG